MLYLKRYFRSPIGDENGGFNLNDSSSSSGTALEVDLDNDLPPMKDEDNQGESKTDSVNTPEDGGDKTEGDDSKGSGDDKSDLSDNGDSTILGLLTDATKELEGLGITAEQIFTEGVTFSDDAAGIAAYAKRVAEVREEVAVTEAGNEFFEEFPAARQLVVAIQQGREKEFYSIMAQGADLPDAIDEKNTEQHHKIIKDAQLRQGMTEEVAEAIAKGMVLSEKSYQAAKEITEARTNQIKKENEAKSAAVAAQQAAEREATVARLKQEELMVKSGTVGNIRIPVGEQDAFNSFRLRPSGDPKAPNESARNLKLQSLTPEERISLDYFLYKMDKNGIDLSKLATADKVTKKTAASSAFGGGGKSGMGSGSASKPGDKEEFNLD